MEEDQVINANLCTIPEREQSLKLTVESLRPQVGQVNVILNDYKYAPSFLKTSEMTPWFNTMTDASKFLWVKFQYGYVFTCDDDIVYPPTYVQDTIKAIDKYKCIVTYHGKKYPRPFESFYRLERNYRCLGAVLQDAQVDVGGSGVMAWHTDHFKFKYEDCLEPNMADIWVSKAAHEQKVKIMALAHKADYFQHTSHKENIFATENAKKFVRQTEILKSFLN